MTKANWEDGSARAVGLFLNGDAIPQHDADGNPIEGGSFLLLVNGADVDVAFKVPARRFGRRWTTVFDTARPGLTEGDETLGSGATLTLAMRSVVVLHRSEP
jgi:glycogen operon protein